MGLEGRKSQEWRADFVCLYGYASLHVCVCVRLCLCVYACDSECVCQYVYV